jgi:hypothetical protein
VKRVLAAGLLAGVALVAGAHAAGADWTGPLPDGIRCPPTVAGRALTHAAGGVETVLVVEEAECKYGALHEIEVSLSFDTEATKVRQNCLNKFDTRTDQAFGDITDRVIPNHSLFRSGGAIRNFDHAIAIQWDVAKKADSDAAKSAALDLAQQAEAVALPCNGTGTVSPAPAAGEPPSNEPPSNEPPSNEPVSNEPVSNQPASNQPSGNSVPVGVGLVGGGLLAAVGGMLLGRSGNGGGGDAPTPVPLEDRVIDGPEAIKALQKEGLLETVTRPDGTIGYRPIGDLAQFDHLPQTRVPLRNQPIVDGEQLHDVGALAYHERPDGTFDSATIVAGVQPATPPPPQPPGEPLGDHLAREVFTGHLFEETGSPDPERAAEDLFGGRRLPPPKPVAVAPPPAPTPPIPARPPVDPQRYHRAEMQRNAGEDEAAEQNFIARRAGMLENVYTGIGWFADRAMDVLGKMTGPGGKTVKDVYTVTKGIGKGIGETMTDLDKSHILKGAAEGGFDLVWGRAVDKLPSIGGKSAGSAAGGATKVMGQIAPVGNPTSIVKRPLTPPEALRSGFTSWVQKTVVRNPVKKYIGF